MSSLLFDPKKVVLFSFFLTQVFEKVLISGTINIAQLLDPEGLVQ